VEPKPTHCGSLCTQRSEGKVRHCAIPILLGCKPHLGAPAIRVEIISHPKFFPATKDAGFLFFRRAAQPQSLRFRTATSQIRTAPARQAQAPSRQPTRR
jgi:hypothetical protein